MSDREYFDTLRRRALHVADNLKFTLRPPESDDGKSAPHVAKAALVKAGDGARELIALAAAAEAFSKV